MKIRDGKQDKYETWKKNNTDFYGDSVLRFGEAWADLMEARLSKGEELKDIAEPCSIEADNLPCGGITGYMYGASISFLSDVWEYGEELRRWHNKDVGGEEAGERANENGGVINPAVLTIAGMSVPDSFRGGGL